MDADLRRKERDRTLGVADLARTGDLLAMAELASGEERNQLCLEWLAANDAIVPGAYSSPEGRRDYFNLSRVITLYGMYRGCPLFECEPRDKHGQVKDSSVRIRPDGDGDKVALFQPYKYGTPLSEGRGLLLFRGSMLEACRWLRENRVNKVGSPCQ